MLRRSARSAGIAPRKEDADHGVEPENEVEARGHVGRRDVEEAGAEEGTAREGERKEPSIWEENEGPGDSGADAGVGGGHGTEYVGTGAEALADDVCDDCAIKDSTILGTWSRLREVRQALVRTRQELAKLRSKQSSGGKAEVTQSVNQVATLQKELAHSNAALSRAEGAVEKWMLLARSANLAKQQAEDKAGLAAVERDEALARATVAERALARAEGATAPQQLRRSLDGAALQHELGVHEASLLATGAVEEAEAGAASPAALAFGAHALAHVAAALAHLRADVELYGQSVRPAPAWPLPASIVPAAAVPPLVAARAPETVSANPRRRLVPSNRGARAAAVRIGVRLLEKLQIEPVAWDSQTAKRKVAAARLGAVSGKTDALGDRWRGSGAAKRPREPGGAQGLPAAGAVAFGVVDMVVMGAVPGSGNSLCVADAALGRRSDRSVVEAKGAALLDGVSMLPLASDRVGEVGVDAGGDGHHQGRGCAESC